MPYHVEHHAWPNVPFHKLQAAHELVKDVGGYGLDFGRSKNWFMKLLSY